jgi:polyferredoxin
MAGLPLIAANEQLRVTLGSLFFFKLGVAVAVVIGCIFIYRFFCRYLCPLGAIYALFNKISFYRLRHNKEKCSTCGICEQTCKMGIDPSVNPSDPECIRCGECVKACPGKALSARFGK